jgi:hypothetical protein
MNASRTVTAVIELRLDEELPQGVLIDADGGARPFHGWLQLAGAIEEWRAAACAADATPETDGGGR